MKEKRHHTYNIILVIHLLFAVMQITGVEVYAQLPVQRDSVARREPPKARARRHHPATVADSIAKSDTLKLSNDSMSIHQLQADSIDRINRQNIQSLESPITLQATDSTTADSIPSSEEIKKRIFIPNPTKATWFAVVFPGGGQIYNRKYWKLPIIYGGFAGCAYALTWNGKMYKDYSQAYMDIMDSNPNTNSWQDLLPPNARYDESQLKDIIKRRKDTFRRYRDLSIFATIAVYLISIVDAYVDAELSNFDITPDLSMKLEPAIINNQFNTQQKSVGFQCALRF